MLTETDERQSAFERMEQLRREAAEAAKRFNTLNTPFDTVKQVVREVFQFVGRTSR